MRRTPLLLLITIAAPLCARAQELPIGSLDLAIGGEQSVVMKEIKSRFEVVTVTGQPNTFFVSDGKPPHVNVIGGVAFQNGRLSWIQRTWGSFDGKVNSIEVSKALFAAVESASSVAGTTATITTKSQRVPGIEFKTVRFDFPGRSVTMTTTEAEPKKGGLQVTIDESVRLPQ